MGKRFLWIVILLLLVEPIIIHAQDRESALTRALVFLHAGTASNGYIGEIRPTGVVLLTTEGEEWVPFSEIKRVIIRGKSRPGKGLLYGALLGGYASVYFLNRGSYYGGSEQNQTNAFLHSNLSSSAFVMLLASLPGLLVGAGVGYLIDPGSDGEDQIIDFGTDEASQQRAVTRLRTIGEKSERSYAVRLSVHGTHVYTRAGDWMDRIGIESYYDNQSSFNWMRKIQLAFSVTSDIDAGAAIVWFGEPYQSRFLYGSSGNTYTNASYNQTLDAVGYYVIGQYRPSLPPTLRMLDIIVGGGIGMGNLDYQLNYNYSSSTFNPATSQYTQENRNETSSLSESAISGLVFGEINLILDDGLTLGLYFDHVFAPSKSVPPISISNLSGEKVQFGNSSVGFSLGVSF